MRVVLICGLLILAALLVYRPVGHFEFTNYDDENYISQNPIVTQGLHRGTVLWALTTTYFSYWHPLTWMSHMLDCQLFGLNAGMHHYTSLAFHIANTLLLFLVMLRLTGSLERSALVAALFALHPLHVESVAWLAERKDVLSTFFWLLCMGAYGEFVITRKRSRYLLALLFCAMGLMSKPMVVTLPFVLLLMDFWPLGRLKLFSPNAAPTLGIARSDPLGPAPAQPSPLRRFLDLVIEKLPFFALSAISCAITIFGTSSAGNILSLEKVPLSLRLANVPVSYARYLGKMLCPEGLVPFYPMPDHWAWWQVVGASGLLLCLTLLILALVRRAPYVLFGWLWFLGTLIPTINLVPAGFQSIADRYTYVSLIGIFILVVWAVADLTKNWSFQRTAIKAAALILLLICAGLSSAQVRYWQNSLTLWSHTAAVDPDNVVAHYNLGHALARQGRPAEAVPHYLEALRIKPDHVDAHLNLGGILVDLGQLAEATNHFSAALRIKPNYEKAHNNMGSALLLLGDAAGATNHLALALKSNPNHSNAHFNYGFALAKLGRYDEAIAHYTEALRLSPADSTVHKLMGQALSAQGKTMAAARHFQEALRLQPDDAETHVLLGAARIQQNQLEEGMESLSTALRLDPRSAEAHFQLGVAWSRQRNSKAALDHYKESLRLKPEAPDTLNNLAWIRAADPNPELRSGAEAVELAGRACKLTENKRAVLLGTLAAAYAESGQFQAAVETAQQARDLARSQGEAEVAARNQKLLELYQTGQAYHDPD